METRRILYALSCTVAIALCASALGCTDDHEGKGALAHDDEAIHGFPGPKFPGAGTSSAGHSIAAGVDTVTCDGLGTTPGGTTGPAPGATSQARCFYSDDVPGVPAAMIEWVVEAAADAELVHVRLTFNPDFVDNTYGANAIGWGESAAPVKPKPGDMPKPGDKPKPPKGGKGGHTFKDLVGSDHAEFKLFDAAGALSLQFKLDYLSESASAASGYATLGVTGGDGKMIVGSATDVIAASTSLDRNLNACMFGDFLTDSPATDEHYTPNPAAETWDYRVVYDVWVKQASFGAAGFGHASVDFVHASPSKLGENTVEVTPKECPPDWPYCANPDGCFECPVGGCVPKPPADAGTPDVMVE